METPKHKPHVNIGKIKCDGRGGFLGQLPKDYPSEREILQNASQAIAQLESDKAELLSALEKCWEVVPLDTYEGRRWFDEIDSLIQKHKQ